MDLDNRFKGFESEEQWTEIGIIFLAADKIDLLWFIFYQEYIANWTHEAIKVLTHLKRNTNKSSAFWIWMPWWIELTVEKQEKT